MYPKRVTLANRHSYVYNNPLKYIDPSGHKSRKKWEEEFRDEHGCDPTDQDWWDYQFSLQFDEWIAGFWEYTASLRALLWNADVTLKRDDIGWRIAQAEQVGQAVQLIGERFEGDVRRFTGGVTVVMQSRVAPSFERILDPDFAAGGYEYWGTIYLQPRSDMDGVLHEMGHYFDEQKRFPFKLRFSHDYGDEMRQARVPLLRRDDSEGFAEAFSNYVLREDLPGAQNAFFFQFQVDQAPNASGYTWRRFSPLGVK